MPGLARSQRADVAEPLAVVDDPQLDDAVVGGEGQVDPVGLGVAARVGDGLLRDPEQRAAQLVGHVQARHVRAHLDVVAAAPGGRALLDGLLERQLVERDRAERDQLVAQGVDVALDDVARVVEQHLGRSLSPRAAAFIAPVTFMSADTSSCTGPSWSDSATSRRAS